MSDQRPPNPLKSSVPPPSDLPRCPVCGNSYRQGELICPHCSFVFNRSGQTRLIDGDNITSTPVNRPLYAGLHAERSPITFEIGDKHIVLPLDEQFTVGRNNILASTQPDVDLGPFGAEEAGVSRCHALISYQGPLVYITDLSSLNGTKLNGVALAPDVPRLLHDKDELFLAHLKIRVRF